MDWDTQSWLTRLWVPGFIASRQWVQGITTKTYRQFKQQSILRVLDKIVVSLTLHAISQSSNGWPRSRVEIYTWKHVPPNSLRCHFSQNVLLSVTVAKDWHGWRKRAKCVWPNGRGYDEVQRHIYVLKRMRLLTWRWREVWDIGIAHSELDNLCSVAK